MPEIRQGRVVDWHKFSPSLAIFRLVAADGAAFPSFEGGQSIALRRYDCLLTKKVKEGTDVRYVPDLDEHGTQKRGQVTHSYSIASAPFESAQGKHLEFYVVLERGSDGVLGRFTESLFRIETNGDDRVDYVERIVGDFTLAKRAAGLENVLMVGTGTGLAPFVAMIKQLQFDARRDGASRTRFTLIYANRTYEELAYHRELLDIEASNAFDFVYVPSVSRPTERDRADRQIGLGRANNVLRHIVGLGPSEANAVPPKLPADRPLTMLLERTEPSSTVVLTCGNPGGMEDIAWTAAHVGMRFEKEDW